MSCIFWDTVRFMVCVVWLSLLASCSMCDKSGVKFINDIGNKCNNLTTGQELQMAEINNGNWDKMYIFEPYTPMKNIQFLMGITLNNAITESDIHKRDDINLFVFVNKTSIQLVSPVPRSVIDIQVDIKIQPISRDDAIFIHKGKGKPIILKN